MKTFEGSFIARLDTFFHLWLDDWVSKWELTVQAVGGREGEGGEEGGEREFALDALVAKTPLSAKVRYFVSKGKSN